GRDPPQAGAPNGPRHLTMAVRTDRHSPFLAPGPGPLPGYQPSDLSPHLPVGWAIYLLFGGLFVWCFLGVSGFVQAISALPVLAAQFLRRPVRMPKGFSMWFGFLLLMGLSASQLTQFQNLLSWGWRATIYLGSTFMFLYVLNTSRISLPARRIVNVLAAFWVL